MDPFERHGINRLSPSSLNHFVAEPAHWVMQRLLNLRAPASAAALVAARLSAASISA